MRLFVTATMGILSPPGLSIARPVPRQRETPQRLPITWPRCLGRHAPFGNFQTPSPTPSSTSSDSLEPPSLESLTELQSGYEALVSSALSSD